MTLLHRLRSDRGFVAGAVVASLMILVAAAAPLLAAAAGQEYTTYHDNLLDSARGGVPLGRFGGMSGEHWLGVEPGAHSWLEEDAGWHHPGRLLKSWPTRPAAASSTCSPTTAR